jgi:hypothetical protein
MHRLIKYIVCKERLLHAYCILKHLQRGMPKVITNLWKHVCIHSSYNLLQYKYYPLQSPQSLHKPLNVLKHSQFNCLTAKHFCTGAGVNTPRTMHALFTSKRISLKHNCFKLTKYVCCNFRIDLIIFNALR